MDFHRYEFNSTSISLLIFFSCIAQICHGRLEFVASYGGIIRGAAIHKDIVCISQRNTIQFFKIHDKNNILPIAEFRSGPRNIGQIAIKWPAIYYTWSLPESIWDNLEGIDVSDLDNIHKIQDVNYPASKSGLNWSIWDSRLIADIGEGEDYYRVYDISNPLHPRSLNDEEREREKSTIVAHAFFKSKEIVPQFPFKILYPGNVKDVLASDNRVYLQDQEKSLKTIDVTNPSKPKYLGKTRNPGKVIKLMQSKVPTRYSNKFITGNYEIRINKFDEAEEHGLISIADISNPVKPKIISHILNVSPWLIQVEKIWADGKYLFIFSNHRNTGGSFGVLVVYDIGNPQKPRYLGYHERFDGPPGGISIQGSMFYIANHTDGLMILRYKNEGDDEEKEDFDE